MGTDKMKHTTFPEGTTDKEIFEMLFDGKLKCLCSCRTLNIVAPEPDIFTCTGCGEKCLVATMNPKYQNV